MTEEPPEESHKLREQILDYLDKHPGAADTVEGVCSWWLMSSDLPVCLDTVERVLDSLEQEELIMTRHAEDNRVIYSLNKGTVPD
jgi:Fe2+ or Zn2+ uptake regulation protein